MATAITPGLHSCCARLFSGYDRVMRTNDPAASRPRLATGVELADPTAGEWIAPRLLPWGAGRGTPTGSVVPTGFPAYARVLHPPTVNGRAATWSQVARSSGAMAHAGMQWEAIAAPDDDAIEPPEVGSLPAPLARALVASLRDHTTSPDLCWFAVWDGFGDLPYLPAPRLEHPGRSYVVLRADLDAAAQPLWEQPGPGAARYQSPNLWWPDDRAWVVATEIDFRWTYVAGSEACVAAIVGNEGIEAYEVDPEDRADIGGDLLNPPPPGARRTG